MRARSVVLAAVVLVAAGCGIIRTTRGSDQPVKRPTPAPGSTLTAVTPAPTCAGRCANHYVYTTSSKIVDRVCGLEGTSTWHFPSNTSSGYAMRVRCSPGGGTFEVRVIYGTPLP